MKPFLLLLLTVISGYAQSERWSYDVPGLPPDFDVERIDIHKLRHDASGNVALVIRYTVDGGTADQVRWVAANGNEIGATSPGGIDTAIIAVSGTNLLLTFTNPDTGERMLRRLSRAGKSIKSADVLLGVGNSVFSAEAAESPTNSNFFVEKRTGPTTLSISRYSVRK